MNQQTLARHLARRRQPKALIAATSLVALPFLVQAQIAAPATAASAPATDTTLPAVRVKATSEQETATGPVTGYRAKRSATATKTDTPLKDTPQSVTIITRDQIVDQGATNLQDALNYAAGVRPDAYGLDSRTDSARIRGGYPDEYLDGLRKNFDYYTSNARTEPFTLERIDVLRGPAAMLYGQGSVGGVINMVSKRPQAEAQGEIGVQYGSFNRRQVQADFTGPLTEDGQWLYRLIGVVRKADTQVDHVRDDRQVLAPSITWQPNGVTSITFQALAQRDRTGSTSQFFPWAGTVAPNPSGQLPTSRFIGEPGWDRYDTDREFAGWLLEHKLSENWTVRQNVRYTQTDVDYFTHYGDSFTVAGDWAGDLVNKRQFGRFADASTTRTKLLATDQNVQGKFNTGSVEHQVLAGIDFARYRREGESGFGYPVYYQSFGFPPSVAYVPLIDAYAPTYGNFTAPEMSPNASSTQQRGGVYLQDQLRFDTSWLVTLGLRHDRVRNRTDAFGTTPEKIEEHSATSKRVGLLYAAAGGWSPYLSYSESFTPLANIGDQSFKPLKGKQWEAGIKYEPTGVPLSLNVALFDVREVNQLKQDPITTLYQQLDETKATGLEFEFKGEPVRGLEIISSYTYTDLSDKLEQAPRHQASAWGKWKLATVGIPGVSVGAGARYMSAYNDGAAPEQPATTLFDAMVAWENAHWRAALNINNLADKIYIASCGSRGDCWYGARRNAVASVSYRW